MFTIYTFGDPQLLREALLALATVFGLSEWWDGTSGFGLGGNMLAVALIGLIGVAIAGITSQQLRLDYLLVALILFGVGFGSKTSVQVEDIQTGASYVVADIPIGIAAVAAAASSAARNLTETMGTALQRPGVTTSVLTDGGFLDPLRTLYALRMISFQELNPTLNKSLLEFYRTCVGYTMANSPEMFDQGVFQTTANPIAYMLDAANVEDWSTVYYSLADPAGVVTPCHTAAGALSTAVDTLTSAGSDALIAKMRLTLGTKLYDSTFTFTDLDDAANIASRGVFDGQTFINAALVRNFINTAEAWRLSSYGDAAAKYALEVTGALDQQRGGAALQGTIWLQMMFPMMTFFQFVFISLAPFIALIVVASPFTAGKTLGGYLLFGVWCYAWMPVAAVVNHYIQINLGNTLEYADAASLGSHYTAIVGMDDFYNQLANKLTIGSNALAAVPMIVGSILFLSFQGLTSLGGKLSQASAATRVSSTAGSPTPAVSAPLYQFDGVMKLPTGQTKAPGGIATVVTQSQRMWGGVISVAQSVDRGVSASQTHIDTKQQALTTTLQDTTGTISSAIETGSVGNTKVENFRANAEQGVASAWSDVLDLNDLRDMSAQEVSTINSKGGFQIPYGLFGASKENSSGTGNSRAFSVMEKLSQTEGAQRSARMARSLEEAYRNDSTVAGEFRKAAGTIEAQGAELKEAQSMERAWGEMAQSVNSNSILSSGDFVDLAQKALLQRPAGLLMDDIDARLAASFGGDFGEFNQAVMEEYVRAPGNHLSNFYRKDKALDRLIATNIALQNAMESNPKAIGAKLSFLEGLGVGVGPRTDTAGIHVADVRERLAGGKALEERVDAGVNQSLLDEVGSLSSRRDEIIAASDANRDAGKANVKPPEGAGSGVDDRFNQNSDRVFGANFRDLSPAAQEIGAKFAQTQSFMRGVAGAANAHSGPSGLLHNFFKGEAGWRDMTNVVQAGLAGSAEDREEGLGRLQVEMQNRGHVNSAGTFDTRTLRNDFEAGGLSEKEAFLATFAAVAPRKGAAQDYLPTAVAGGMGLLAGGKSALALGKAGPVGVALGVGLFAANTSYSNRQGVAIGTEMIRSAYKNEFAVANAGNDELISAFNASIDQAGTTAEMTAVLVDKRYDLSNEQMAKVEAIYRGSGGRREDPSP